MLENLPAPPVPGVTTLLRGPIRNFLRPFEPAIQKALGFDDLVAFFRIAAGDHEKPPFARLLSLLQVECRVPPEDLARIPASGPVVAVANHPFGLLEGAILAALLPRVR